MKHAHLIYPHQLFKKEYLPEGITHVFLIEDPLFFGTDQKTPVFYHRQKLILHRASMHRYMEEVLWPAGYDVTYVTFSELVDSGDVLQKLRGFDTATVFTMIDDTLHRKLQTASRSVPDIPVLHLLDSPNFYLKQTEIADYFGGKLPAFSTFYQWQRERWNVLIGDDYKPVGGKWMFDDTAAKPMPKDEVPPTFEVFGANKYVEEAKDYVRKNFPDNPGDDSDFCWPTNHQEAEAWTSAFISSRLPHYAQFHNAIDATAPWGYHSAISPMLNCGLLSPQEVIAMALQAHAKKPIDLASLELFIRSILGWREYVRGIYQTHHVALRTANGFSHHRKLSQDWYEGTTGIPPLDDMIKKVRARGYLQPAERLHIVGNLMLLAEIDPNDVFSWCMEMSIDGYDWALVPTVYSLSQFADGGSMQHVPACSPSEALLEVSQYEHGDWADIWDGLYWGFIAKHRQSFAHNPHMKQIIRELDRMNEDRMRIIGYRAQDFLSTKTKSA